MKPLLVVDGDWFARATVAMPKTVRLGCVVGFTVPAPAAVAGGGARAVLVGWDSLGQVPTYRNEAFEAYQSGRVFDKPLLEQLEMLPPRRGGRVRVREGAGLQGDDFLAAAALFEEARGGTALVATSDRDAFQLASERTTILGPVRGVSELARIGPAEVRERYGSIRAGAGLHRAARRPFGQAPRGGRRPAEEGRQDILREYGSLEAALSAGRFSAEAEDCSSAPGE